MPQIQSKLMTTCVLKGVLDSVSMANIFSTRSSLNSEFSSESMGKQKSIELSVCRKQSSFILPSVQINNSQYVS